MAAPSLPPDSINPDSINPFVEPGILVIRGYCLTESPFHLCLKSSRLRRGERWPFLLRAALQVVFGFSSRLNQLMPSFWKRRSASLMESKTYTATLCLLGRWPLGDDPIRHEGYGIQGLAFLPDGKTLVAGEQNSVRFWETATGRRLGTIAMISRLYRGSRYRLMGNKSQ